MMNNNEKVQVIFCPCGEKVRQAGRPNPSATLKEKRGLAEMVLSGCSVDTISIDEYRAKGYDMCFDDKDCKDV